MTSANQLYKNSGSTLPFKEWLKREQLKGNLKAEKKEFVNATGATRSDVEDQEAYAQQVLLATKDNEYKKSFRKGVLVGIVVGVVGKVLFDKFYKKR